MIGHAANSNPKTVFDSKGTQVFIFAIIEYPTRKLIIANSTANPTMSWVIQQFRNCSISGEPFPKAIVHDRDGIYGHWLPKVLQDFECQSFKIPPRSPWENPFIERFFLSLKHEILNRVPLVDNNHIQNLTLSYKSHFNNVRPHQGIGGKTPNYLETINVTSPDIENLKVEKVPELDGLVTKFWLAA